MESVKQAAQQELSEASAGPLPTASAVPLYEQIKRELSERILMGAWTPGAVLPSEIELARAFSVAVGTVRRALSDLTREGLLTRRRKTGTIVTGRRPHHSLRSFFQYFRLHAADGSLLRSRAQLLSLERGPAIEDESARLEGVSGEMLRIRRLRRIDGRAVMYDRMTMSAARLPGFPGPQQVPELLHLFLLNRYGIRISAVRESITAEAATLEDARLLDLESAQAVLVIDEVAYDQRGTATIWALHRAVTDRYCYLNEVR